MGSVDDNTRSPPIRGAAGIDQLDGRGGALEVVDLELARARIAPEQDLDQMIASAVESFETQQALTAGLKDCHFTTPGGTPDPPSA